MCPAGLGAVWWVILLDYKFVVILQDLELKKAVSILALCPLGFLSVFFCLRSHLAALENHSIRTDSNGVENEMYAYCPRLASLLLPSRRLQLPACSNPLAVVQKLVGNPSPLRLCLRFIPCSLHLPSPSPELCRQCGGCLCRVLHLKPEGLCFKETLC